MVGVNMMKDAIDTQDKVFTSLMLGVNMIKDASRTDDKLFTSQTSTNHTTYSQR